MTALFADREAAGRALASRLLAQRLKPPIVVLALPRGGVPVAAPVALALDAPLDLLLVRKIGLPWQPELAVAAVVDGEHPEVVIDAEVQDAALPEPGYIEAQTELALLEIARRRRAYLHGRPPLSIEGCTVVVVDDGIATGTTMRAALKALRHKRPARLVLAVPVAPAAVLDELRKEVDMVVCLLSPVPFWAVGAHYADFHQLADDEVQREMDAVAAARGARPPGTPPDAG